MADFEDDDNPFADKGDTADDFNPFDDSMFDKKVACHSLTLSPPLILAPQILSLHMPPN